MNDQKNVDLSELSTEDILKELERRYTSPTVIEQFTLRQKAIQFKKNHIKVFEAALTIHEFCEATEEQRDGHCDTCFLYDPRFDMCAVGWTEKEMDENILRLCKADRIATMKKKK